MLRIRRIMSTHTTRLQKARRQRSRPKTAAIGAMGRACGQRRVPAAVSSACGTSASVAPSACCTRRSTTPSRPSASSAWSARAGTVRSSSSSTCTGSTHAAKATRCTGASTAPSGGIICCRSLMRRSAVLARWLTKPTPIVCWTWCAIDTKGSRRSPPTRRRRPRLRRKSMVTQWYHPPRSGICRWNANWWVVCFRFTLPPRHRCCCLLLCFRIPFRLLFRSAEAFAIDITSRTSHQHFVCYFGALSQRHACAPIEFRSLLHFNAVVNRKML